LERTQVYNSTNVSSISSPINMSPNLNNNPNSNGNNNNNNTNFHGNLSNTNTSNMGDNYEQKQLNLQKDNISNASTPIKIIQNKLLMSNPNLSYFSNQKKQQQQKIETDAKNVASASSGKINYAYNSSVNSQVKYGLPQSAKDKIEQKSSNIADKYLNSKSNNVNNLEKNDIYQTKESTSGNSKEFLVELVRAATETRMANIRKENSQHLPPSIEKQMAKNFKSLSFNPSPTISSSFELSVENNNHHSKCTDTTSLCTDQSLKDEDAWLPILNIAEEQVNYIFIYE
jgi:hypothetical protein